MPGIHVRSIGRLHWEDHDKEPTLTVPGSYWLCHKNNIYKFTFKFHKTIRNAIDFSHSKELMKIIRRVIKWQPRQGQHFSTKNLLVTYNHASWTRQDKMFAVMKFCDRPDAIAFPHAFILTVKVLNQDQQLVENIMGGKETKPQVPVSVGGAIPPETSPSDKVLKDKETILNKQEIVSTSSQEEKENKSDTSWSLRTRSRHKDVDSNSLSTTVTVRHNSSEKVYETSVNGDCSVESDVVEEELDSSKDMNSDFEGAPSQRAMQPMSDLLEHDENSNSSNGSHSDSASLPYQYLIERDIERELENSRLAGTGSSKENDSASANDAIKKPVTSREQIDGAESQGSRDSRKSTGKQKVRNEMKESDSALPPDVTNLRSSDITDLVMKGLMFTIRQDKDTVTVVEQKTKLEVDEVLENSEKVETKEGDPCLLNSSLLRLEKMITRMQEPPPLTDQKPNGLADNAFVSFVDLADEINIETEKMKVSNQMEKKGIYHSTGSVESANSWSQFFTDKAISDATFENIEKVLGDSSVYLRDDQDDDLELKIDDEEEEDIIPEALVNNAFFDGSLDAMRKTPMLDTFEDLLMDDIEPENEIIDVVDVEEVKNINISQTNHDSKINGITVVKDSSRLPKVISNELITNDQIPPALLKALKSKSSIHQNFHHNEVTTSNNVNSSENNKINMENIESEVQKNLTVNGSVQRNIDNNVSKNKMDSIIKNSAVVVLERHKENNFHQSRGSSPVFSSVSSSKVTRKSSLTTESNSGEKSRMNNEIKNSDINNSSSNSNSASSTRLTRSNSKLHIKPNETKASVSDDSTSRQSRIETRSQKFLEKSFNQLLTSKDSIKILKSQKRKRSEIDHDQRASKHHKSVSINGDKEVTIKMWKLISDLTHGVKVVIERVDVTKVSR